MRGLLLLTLLLVLPLVAAKPDPYAGVGGLPENNTTATATPTSHAIPDGGTGVALAAFLAALGLTGLARTGRR